MGLWVRTPRISAERLTVLIGKGEVALCRGRGYERLDRAGQIGQGFGNGNQLAALTLHALFSHVPQTRRDGPLALPDRIRTELPEMRDQMWAEGLKRYRKGE